MGGCSVWCFVADAASVTGRQIGWRSTVILVAEIALTVGPSRQAEFTTPDSVMIRARTLAASATFEAATVRLPRWGA